ncbi:MAG: DNA polymerase I [Clostridiales bacterium]|nr:DNA polymerase I [Clostridiales bacterium]
MNSLVLIDGNSLINRAFYATPPLSAKDGTPTNAVYAFINMLVKIIGDIKPEHILVAFDRKEPTFRHTMYADYKGTRKPMPDDLRPQIDLMKTVLDTMGISRFEQVGIEADDIIGSASKKFNKETIIITGDKDSFQLVDPTTSVYFTRKGISELEIFSADNFKEKMGIEPIQIIDLKSMMGDSSDNIPGIMGVGEKTATSLVQTYGSLENLYNHVDELKGKLREKVENSKDSAFLSKTLATIKTDLDLPFTLEDLTYEFPFSQKTRTLFSSLDLRNLLRKTTLFKEDDEEEQLSFVAEESYSLPSVIEVRSKDSFPKFTESKYAIYIGKNIDLYDGKNEFRIFIRETFFDDGLDYTETVTLLKPLFESDKYSLITFAKKALMTKLDKFDVQLTSYTDDVCLQKYLADFSGREETATEVIEQYSFPQDLPAYSLYKINEILNEKLREEEMTDLYKNLELPLTDVLFQMEKDGFKVDVKTLDETTLKYEKLIDGLLDKIHSIAGEDLNPNSPKQLGIVLFEKLGLKSGKKTKNGYSTNAEVLESIADQHEIVPLILRYRQITKLCSTYMKGLKPLIDSRTGLIHTCFNQTLTTTGRLSSKEPNLQNIPVRDDEGKEIRKFFISSFENGKIVGADYSQIELRLLAHFSGCEPLINAFISGEDIHTLTASQVFGVSISEVTPQMRRSAKAVNFGIIYGISDFGLATQLKIANKKAGEYIKKYFEMYPSVKEYMDSNVKFARENGFVKTMLGRKRYIREIHSSNYNLRSFGERAAMNMPLQGTAADIIKIAMLKVFKRLKKEGLKSKLILQVHDELIVDTHPAEVEIVKTVLKEEMQTAVKLSVPLDAEVSVGDRWFDAK